MRERFEWIKKRRIALMNLLQPGRSKFLPTRSIVRFRLDLNAKNQESDVEVILGRGWNEKPRTECLTIRAVESMLIVEPSSGNEVRIRVKRF